MFTLNGSSPKKILFLCFIVLMCLSLVGCGATKTFVSQNNILFSYCVEDRTLALENATKIRTYISADSPRYSIAWQLYSVSAAKYNACLAIAEAYLIVGCTNDLSSMVQAAHEIADEFNTISEYLLMESSDILKSSFFESMGPELSGLALGLANTVLSYVPSRAAVEEREAINRPALIQLIHSMQWPLFNEIECPVALGTDTLVVED